MCDVIDCHLARSPIVSARKKNKNQDDTHKLRRREIVSESDLRRVATRYLNKSTYHSERRDFRVRCVATYVSNNANPIERVVVCENKRERMRE